MVEAGVKTGLVKIFNLFTRKKETNQIKWKSKIFIFHKYFQKFSLYFVQFPIMRTVFIRQKID